MKQDLSLNSALKSFIGYLEGTKKAAHTISSYRGDLLTFQVFLEKDLAKKLVKLEQISLKDLKIYQEYLLNLGFKTNTRRRKLLTVRKFLRYLIQRKKIKLELSQLVSAPYKLEKVPDYVPIEELREKIWRISEQNHLAQRNKLLLSILAETGCKVSEVTKIHFKDFEKTNESQWCLSIGGKNPRKVFISSKLYEAALHLKKTSRDQPWIFSGFNKFGSLGAPITARGVELLVKYYSGALGFPKLTPRMIRHSVVVGWYEEGFSQQEIQKNLGLKTPYSFKIYEPIFLSKAEAKSRKQATYDA